MLPVAVAYARHKTATRLFASLGKLRRVCLTNLWWRNYISQRGAERLSRYSDSEQNRTEDGGDSLHHQGAQEYQDEGHLGKNKHQENV